MRKHDDESTPNMGLDADGLEPGDDVGPLWAGWLLLAIYAAAVAGRLALKRFLPLPFIFSDEVGYIEQGRTILNGHGPMLGHFMQHSPNWLYPLTLAPILKLCAPAAAWRWMLVLNSLMLNATAPLAYGIARRFASRRAALTAAVLTALSTSMIYASTLMAENVYVPLAVACFWLLLRAMERPTAARRLAAGAMMGLLYHAKPQGLFFPILFGLAVAVDAATEPCQAWPARARRFLNHWLTAVGWAAVFGLRIVEAGWIEGMERPWSLTALLGNYQGRAMGDFPFSRAGAVLMFCYNLAVAGFAVGLLPALRLAAGVGPALSGRGPRRWRQAVTLTACALVFVSAACGRHTVVADREWMVSERFLMPMFPLMFGLFAAGRPQGVGAPFGRARLAALAGWLTAVAMAAGALWLAHVHYYLVLSYVPALAFYWVAADDLLTEILAARVALGALTAVCATAMAVAWAIRRPKAMGAWFVAGFLALANFGFYAAHHCLNKPLTFADRYMATEIRKRVPKNDKLLILMDDMKQNLFFHVRFRCPGLSYRLKAEPESFFAEPLPTTSDGRVVSPFDPKTTWLLTNARWTLEGTPSTRIGRYNLYHLSDQPVLRMDMGRLRAEMAGLAPEPDLTARDRFPADAKLSWLNVRLPKDWRAGHRGSIKIQVRNDGPFTLRPGLRRYAIGYHWSNPRVGPKWEAIVWDDGQRVYLPEALAPGKTAWIKLKAVAPRPAGDGWTLTLAPLLVGEQDRIWQDDASRTNRINLTLREN